jgi:signal transduction histidine kinase
MNAEASRQVVSMANRISTSSGRMARLIEQLVDFARVDQAGDLTLDRVPMDLGSAAHQTIEESGLAFPDAVVDLEVRGSTGGSWDEDRLVQVMSNLVGNAVQHGDGKVRVVVDGQAPDVVRLTVENAGAVIPPAVLPVIFDPFRRASGGFARRRGLGLGLFISKSFVEAHGGSITARSDERLTVFEVVLPRQ